MSKVCPKSLKRDLFCLFKVFSCNGCNNYQEDLEFDIGVKHLWVFYLNNCLLNNCEDDFFLFNKKLRSLLLSYYVIQSDVMLLWLEDIKKLEDYEALLDMLMDMDYHILIITN